MSTELAVSDRAWVTTSPALDCSVETVICIPSFRRPRHLRLTLESVAAQRTGRSFAIVVVENDAARCESAPVAAEFLNAGRLNGICIT